MAPAAQIARTLLDGFDKHYRIFRVASVAAPELFRRQRWSELRAANRARIDLYDLRVQETVELLKRDPEARDESLWPSIKQAYIGLLYGHRQPELAETFFNSVATRVLHRTYHNNQNIFSRPAVATEHIEGEQPTYRCYYPVSTGLRRCLLQIVRDFGLDVPLAHPRRCTRNLLHALRSWEPARRKREPNFHIQVLSSLFYRSRGAYALGRVVNGARKALFAIALVHAPQGGLVVDALVKEKEDLANLLSVAHAYFLVDMEVPSSWIDFIHDALPEKPKAELYTAVGLEKQGKTLFFRDLHQHLKHSDDLFALAPGARGMVMLVFTLPSFPFVFKIIRDRFEPPKDTSRAHVMEKYRLVKMHERIGRLADTLEYADIALPRARFEPGLLEEMRRLIPGSIELTGASLTLRHAYVEQRLTPLDLYLREADALRREHGLREYGQALRELAACNIFPGDILPKNFGVSPYGRVLFYDYDEVCYLTECNFREMPSPRNEEDELRAETWYSVGPHDIFPEEFATFLFPTSEERARFRELHGELFTARFWLDAQSRVLEDIEPELYPYPPSIRFEPPALAPPLRAAG
ncbi:MAG: bifunctional isocitrate dehydrogenase kinase/phosphatase [Oligoflexia bacterium]|nr:bifunctional isocitrate dehydrogenase kinase/phosphatase [Oligoflexia bacterium]